MIAARHAAKRPWQCYFAKQLCFPSGRRVHLGGERPRNAQYLTKRRCTESGCWPFVLNSSCRPKLSCAPCRSLYGTQNIAQRHRCWIGASSMSCWPALQVRRSAARCWGFSLGSIRACRGSESVRKKLPEVQGPSAIFRVVCEILIRKVDVRHVFWPRLDAPDPYTQQQRLCMAIAQGMLCQHMMSEDSFVSTDAVRITIKLSVDMPAAQGCLK